jgi:hypothetical protein
MVMIMCISSSGSEKLVSDLLLYWLGFQSFQPVPHPS